MGVRENKVERYLRSEVKELGGDTRKWVSPGQDGVPDQIVMGVSFLCPFFVEVKTHDGKLSPAQKREHVRLRDFGATVCTVWGNKGVDLLIEGITKYGAPLEIEYA